MKLLSNIWNHFVAKFFSLLALTSFCFVLTHSIHSHAQSNEIRQMLAQYQVLKEKEINHHAPEDDLVRLAALENAPYQETLEYLISLLGFQIDEIKEAKKRGRISANDLLVATKTMDILARLVNDSYAKRHQHILDKIAGLEQALHVNEWNVLKGSEETLRLVFLSHGEQLPSLEKILFAGLRANPPVIDQRALVLLYSSSTLPLEKDLAMDLIYYFSKVHALEVSRFYNRLISTNFFDSSSNSHRADSAILGRVVEVVSKEPRFAEDYELKASLTQLKKEWAAAAESFAKRGHHEQVDKFKYSVAALENLLKPRTGNVDLRFPPLANSLASIKEPVVKEDGLKSEIEKLKAFKAKLANIVIGQSEAIEALFDIEFSKYLHPNRQAPEVLYLLGAPGTGKDTLVEAYVDHLKGYEGAHQAHLFRMKVAKDRESMNAIMGSSTGYVGSEDMPPFIRYLADHSGGRYIYVEKKERVEAHIVENPEWKGRDLPGFESAGKAVIFVNEFHNWSSDAKDEILKEFTEKGFVTIKRPGVGISKLFVPATIIFASNEGMNLVNQTDRNGLSRGGKLSVEELQNNWRRVRNDKKSLKEAIRSTNMGQSRSAHPKGISPEMLSRIPESRLVLMKPLLPSELTRIVEIKLRQLERKYQDGPLSKVRFKWSPKLIEYIQQYNYSADEGARATADNVNELIGRTIKEAVLEGKITSEMTEVVLDIKIKNQKGTQIAELVFSEPKGEAQKLQESSRQVIVASSKVKRSKTLSSKEVDEIRTLAQRLKQHVVGQDFALERIANELIVAKADGGDINRPRPAQKFFALGWSSTGKTETAKAIARELFGNESALKVTDFSQVRSIQDIKEKVLGTTDFNGEPVPSEFMLEYDKRQGKMIIVLDEIANAPEGVLNALYDVLREATVSTFSDGKPRPMTDVIIFMTGNAGENSSKGIPQDISLEEQMAAFEEVYRQTMRDPAIQRMTLEKYFSNAFINRVGEQNFFFYSPLGIEALRQLSHLKIKQALKAIENSAYAWKVRFKSMKDYLGFLDTLEKESMIVREQGSSIDRGVNNFINALRLKLILEKTPPKSTITIGETRLASEVEGERRQYSFDVEVKSGRKLSSLQVELKGRIHTPRERRNKNSAVLTAYHEAGHEVVRQAIFNGEFASNLISTRPGVTQIGGDWIHYAGIAKSDVIEVVRMNYANVIRHMAVNAGGYVAESLMTSDNDHSAGKSNDMERASQLAQKAILEWGLSEAWGTSSRPPNMSLSEFIADLSEERRSLLEREISRMVMDAEILARAALLNNMKIFRAMGYRLAEIGTLDRAMLNDFYARTQLVHADKFKWSAAEKQTLLASKESANRDENARRRALFAASASGVRWRHADAVPAQVADNDEILKREREARLQTVRIDVPTEMIAELADAKQVEMTELRNQRRTEKQTPLEAGSGIRCEMIFKN